MERSVDKRITCKQALIEVKRIKIERDNYYNGFKRLNKKTSSVILKKEYMKKRVFKILGRIYT